MLDEPSTEHRADGGGYRREAGPCANGAAALVFVETSADQRQAAGYKESSADSLETPCQDELRDIGR